MALRFTPLALPAALLAGLAALAEDPVPTIPPTPAVPAKVDLPPKNFTEPLPGGAAKFDMVYIPGGEFLMGSPDAEPGRRPDEGPQHKVTVRPFWLAKCEVTWDEYYLFWKDEALIPYGKEDELPEELQNKVPPDALTRPSNTYVPEQYDHGKDRHPALCMSHHAAMMYCQWLRWKTKKGYRLPTEAEWEFACRAGHDGPFGFGPADKLGDYAWYKANSAEKVHVDAADERDEQGRTHQVGTKKANAFGLQDMHGNVAEWCLDHYDPGFYSKFPADKLALGPVNPPTSRKWGHVVRGGSWADAQEQCRSAARRVSDKSWIKFDPQLPQSIWWLTRMDVIGFRVALPAEEYPELVGLKPMVPKKAD